MNMTMYLYIGQSLKAVVKRSATIVEFISETGLQKSRGNTILKVIQVTFISYIRNLPITALSSSFKINFVPFNLLLFALSNTE